MRIRRILIITKRWMVVITVLALLSWVGATEATESNNLGPMTVPSDQAAEADNAPRSCIPYEEKKQIAVPETFGTGPQCHAKAYEAITEKPLEQLDIASWLCFSCSKGTKARTCFEARSKFWFHQFVDRLETVPIFSDREPRRGVLFVAESNGGGSGWSKLITLWVYRRESWQFVNILPEILITRSDEFKFLSDHKGKRHDILVVAEYAPAEGETRLDRSAYRIRIYRYRHERKKFQLIVGGEFLTKRKYSFKFEGVDTTEIIDDQMEEIRRVLDRTCS